MTPTTPANLAKINKMFYSLHQTLADLHGRWLDEQGFESLDAYSAMIAKRLPKGFKLTKMTKRPFGFHFTIGTNAVYSMTHAGTQARWQRVS